MTTNHSFRKVSIHMERARGYGHYYIRAIYRGKAIKVLTTDSELWDSFTNPECKDHRDALRQAYNSIVNEYQNQMIYG
jgi:hypothetical protein